MFFRIEYMSVHGHRTGDGFYIEDFISATWVTRYNEHGEATLELPYRYAPMVRDMYRFPVTPYLLFSESDETMFMTGAKIKQSEGTGEPVVVLSFSTLDKFLSFRKVTYGNFEKDENVNQSLIERVIRNEFIDRYYTPQLTFKYDRFNAASLWYWRRQNNWIKIPMVDCVYGKDVQLQLGDSSVWDVISYYGMNNDLRVTMRLNDPDIDDRGWCVHIEDFSNIGSQFGANGTPPIDISSYVSFTEAYLDPKDFYNAYEYIYPYVQNKGHDAHGFDQFYCVGERVLALRGGDRNAQTKRWISHSMQEYYYSKDVPVHRYPLWARVERAVSYLDYYNLSGDTWYTYNTSGHNDMWRTAGNAYTSSTADRWREPPSSMGGLAVYTCKIENTDEFVFGRDYHLGSKVTWAAFDSDMVARSDKAKEPMITSRVLEHMWSMDGDGVEQTTVLGSSRSAFSTLFSKNQYD